MPTKHCRPELYAQMVSEYCDWLENTTRYCADLVTDQWLALAGYKIRFAIDFRELYGFIHPWGTCLEETTLETVFATAFAMHGGMKREALHKCLLLPEYLEEFLEHALFLSRAGFDRERAEQQAAVESLVKTYPIIADVSNVAPDDLATWCEANREAVVEVLRADFLKVAKVALSSSINYTPDQTSILKLQSDYFDGPQAYEGRWPNGIGEGAEFKELYDALYTVRFPKKRHGRRLSYERDARALQTVIELNRRNEATDEREIVYLLTASPRFYIVPRHFQGFHKACRLSRSLPGDAMEISTSVIRHPFTLILFLAHWGTPDAVVAPETRREFITECERIHRYASLALAGIEERCDFYENTCRGQPRGCRYAKECAGIEDELAEHGREAGSWVNLALALQRSQLLPESYAVTGMLENVKSFLELLAKDHAKDTLDQHIKGRAEAHYGGAVRAAFHLLMRWVHAAVSLDFVTTRLASLSVFPYALRFQDVRIVRHLDDLYAACIKGATSTAALDDTAVASIRAPICALAALLDPVGTESLENGEATILTAALLVLSGELPTADALLESYTFERDSLWHREGIYLRLLISYRAVLGDASWAARPWETAAAEVEDLRQDDERIQRTLLTVEYEKLRREGSISTARAEEIIAQFATLESYVSNKLQASQEPYARRRLETLLSHNRNNQVDALLRLGSRLKRGDWLDQAFKIATTRLEQDPSVLLVLDVQHTIGLAYAYYAKHRAHGDQRETCCDKAAEYYASVDAGFAGLLVGGEARRKELAADIEENEETRRQIAKAKNE